MHARGAQIMQLPREWHSRGIRRKYCRAETTHSAAATALQVQVSAACSWLTHSAATAAAKHTVAAFEVHMF